MIKFLSKSLVAILFVLFVLPSVALAGTDTYSLQLPSGKNSLGNFNPGKNISSTVILKMTGDKVQNFSIDSFFRSGPEMPSDPQSYFIFPKGKEFELTPEKREIKIPFTIKIPDTMTPGDYSIGISAQSHDALALQKKTTGVIIGTALAVKMNFSVNGERTKKLTFTNLSLEQLPGDNGAYVPKVIFNYLNEGNAKIAPVVKVLVTDSFGKVIFDVEKTLKVADPSKSTSDSLVLEGVDMKVFWGSFDVSAEMYFDDNGKKVEVGRFSTNHTVIPWQEIVTSIVLLLLIVLVLLFKYLQLAILRRRSGLYVVCNGDTIQSLCNKFNLDPNKLIMVNKFKSPFFLQPGLKIFIPKKNN